MPVSVSSRYERVVAVLIGHANPAVDIAGCREDMVVEEELVFFSDVDHLRGCLKGAEACRRY